LISLEKLEQNIGIVKNISLFFSANVKENAAHLDDDIIEIGSISSQESRVIGDRKKNVKKTKKNLSLNMNGNIQSLEFYIYLSFK